MPGENTTTETTQSTEAAELAASVASEAAAAAAAALVASGSGAPAGVPATYELKLPDGSSFDAALVTRTADTARALGLTNEAAQKLLDAQIVELTTATTSAAEKAATDAKAAQLEAMKPGGALWNEREAEWSTQSLADPEIGGSPEKLQANVTLAKTVLTKFATPDAIEFFEATGLGSHPAVVRMFAKIGRSMSEASLVLGGTDSAAPRTEQERLALRYPTMAAKSS